MLKKIISVILLTAILIIPALSVIASGTIPITDFQETDPLTVFTSNASRVTYTAFKSGNQTQSFSKTVSDIAENSSFNYQFGWRNTAQSVGSGSAQLYIGFSTYNITAATGWNATDNYSLGMYYYQTGTGIFMQLVESYNGTNYGSANTTISINDPKYFQISRNDTSNLSFLKIYNDSNYSSLNVSFNLTLHSKPAYTYMFFPVSGNGTSGTTSMTGFIENLYRNDTPETMTVTTQYLAPITSPFVQYGTINSTGWLGNVTDYGFRAGSANGTWDYTASTINYTDLYGTYNNTSNGTIMTYFYGIGQNQTLYYQAFAAGYDSFGVYKTFYGSILSFTNNFGASTTQFAVTTGNISQITNPVTGNQAVLLAGSTYGGSNPVSSWGFLVGNTSSSVSNLSVATIQLAHTGILSSPVFSEYYDYSTDWSTVYARAFAIDTAGIVVYGSIVTMNTTATTPVVITLTEPTIISNTAVLYATLSRPVYANQLGFSFGTSNDTSNWYSVINSTSSSIPTYGIASQVLTLTANTTYYYKAQLFTNQWIYSAMGNFTTGISWNATTSAPIVVTYPALAITDVSFNTSVLVLGANLTTVGIQIRGLLDSGWQTVTINATYGSATYNLTVSGLTANTSYYYRGIAFSGYGTGVGTIHILTTLPIAPTPLVIPPTPGNTTVSQGANQMIQNTKNLLLIWGMDNMAGHLIFGLIISLLIGWLVYWLISKTGYKKIAGIGALVAGILTFSAMLIGGFFDATTILVIVTLVGIGLALGFLKILGGKKNDE